MHAALKQYVNVQHGSSDDLINQHGELVHRIAHHLRARLPDSVQVDDLVQSGMVALIEASGNYRPDTGVPFEAYARLRIRGAMIDELRRSDWTPRSVHRKGRAIADAMARLNSRAGNASSSDKQIAEEAGLSLDEYHATLKDSAGAAVLSLDEMPFEQSQGVADPAHSGPEDCFRKSQQSHLLASAISELPDREKLVINLYYHEELNLREIGMVLGVSESRVSQIHSKAMLRLRGEVSAELKPEMA